MRDYRLLLVRGTKLSPWSNRRCLQESATNILHKFNVVSEDEFLTALHKNMIVSGVVWIFSTNRGPIYVIEAHLPPLPSPTARVPLIAPLFRDEKNLGACTFDYR